MSLVESPVIEAVSIELLRRSIDENDLSWRSILDLLCSRINQNSIKSVPDSFHTLISALRLRSELSLMCARQISALVLDSLPAEQKSMLFTELCALAGASDSMLANQFNDVIKQLPISAELALQTLNLSVSSSSIDSSETISFLEVLQYKIASIPDFHLLVKPLFGILDSILAEKKSLSEAAYSLRLVLACLITAAKNIRNVECVEMASLKSVFSGPSLMNVIQFTSDDLVTIDDPSIGPQTRNQALLLLSEILVFAPEMASDIAIPIFRVIASPASLSIDDSYSFVILQNFAEVLLKALGTDSDIRFELLDIFVNAFDSIQSSRRLVQFSTLLSSMGFPDSFWRCINLMVVRTAQNAMSSSSDEKEANDIISSAAESSVISFAMELSAKFSEDQQLLAFSSIVDNIYTPLVGQIPIDEHIAVVVRLVSRFVLNFESNSEESVLKHSQLSLFRALFEALQRETKRSSESKAAAELINKSVNSRKRKRVDTASSQSAGAGKSIAETLGKCLDHLNASVPVNGFVQVVKSLLKHSDSRIRRKALQLLCEKANSPRRFDSIGSDWEDLLGVLKPLRKMLEDEVEAPTNKTIALVSMDGLARTFAAEHPKSFMKCAPSVVELLGSGQASVSSAALLCIGTFSSESGPGFVKFLPVVMEKLFSIMKETLESGEGSDVDDQKAPIHLSAVLEALRRVICGLSDFIPSYLETLLPLLLHPKMQHSDLSSTVEKLFTELNERVSLRQSLPHFLAVFNSVVAHGDASIIGFFRLLSGSLSSHGKTARKECARILRVFLGAFELRYRSGSEITNIDVVEDEVINALLSLVVKLSEKQLQHVFTKLVEWSGAAVYNAENANDVSKSVTFFKIVNKLADTLQAIFVPYFGNIMDYCVAVLANLKTRSSGLPTEDSVESKSASLSPKRRKISSSSRFSERFSAVHHVVCALTKCFANDQGDSKFMNNPRFEKIVEPLVDLLSAAHSALPISAYRAFVSDTLIQCLGQLLMSVEDLELWKLLLNRVLSHTQNQHPSVRLGAVSAVRNFYRLRGDRFLDFLPETVTVVVELLEDSDPGVEAASRELINDLEKLTGESFEEYMK
eukprot:405205_1